jgi:hypothetical protein
MARASCLHFSYIIRSGAVMPKGRQKGEGGATDRGKPGRRLQQPHGELVSPYKECTSPRQADNAQVVLGDIRSPRAAGDALLPERRLTSSRARVDRGL